MEEKVRLQKLIAQSGLTSRRKAEELISQGKVKVNGEVVTTLGTLASLDDKIEVDGQLLGHEKLVYYLFNKPLGVVTTVSDDRGRKTVSDYFKDIPERVFPVGRLDFNTAGLLVMTNDGELANLMMHPSSHLNKTYLARIDKPFTFVDKAKLEKGIMLEDGLTAPAEVYIKSDEYVAVTIHEGRNREVRRMFEALGYKVLSLTRTSIAFLKITGLDRGTYKEIPLSDIERLKTMCKKQKEHNHYIKVK